MPVNPAYFELVRQRLTKQAFVPSDVVAQGAGGGQGGGQAPPMDPSAGGGAPPGGPMPGGPGGDPSAGGAPPMDPSGQGGMPGAPTGGQDALLDAKIQQAVQSAVQASGGQGGAAGGPGKVSKKDELKTIMTDVYQLKKLVYADMRRRGEEPPPDILDGPGRHPVTGELVETPESGSDASGETGAAVAQTQPGAIPPIQPIQSAMPTPKQASFLSEKLATADLLKQASSLLYLYGVMKEREGLKEDVWACPEEKQVLAEKRANELIYANAKGPGQPFALPGQRVHNKAAALANVFKKRRK